MPEPQTQRSRRQFLTALSVTGVGTLAFQRALAAQVAEQTQVTAEMISQAEWVAGIELEEDEREQVARSLERILRDAQRLRSQDVDADTVPALVFRPDFFYEQTNAPEPISPAKPGTKPADKAPVLHAPADQKLEVTDHDLPFTSLATQARLLASQAISSQELTQLYIERLEKYDPMLHCVVTSLPEHALKLAAASDARRAKGESLGVLDGIPWVAKDLIAIPPWKTTWGAVPFQDQIRHETATVATKLQAAGAVLLAKVTLGALAWGDKWFGGMTRNPWNAEQGSSGSSAGSAAAVAAGLTTYALGSETLGSIVSPCRRCRTSGLRPTFGRVSRAGCMPLAWSMDKIGPIARHVEDLALVFPYLLGKDGKDPTLVERAFAWPQEQKVEDFRIGVTPARMNKTEKQALEYFESEGATIVEIDLDSELPVSSMSFILGTEASTVFDDVFRREPQADYGKWPATFREAQFIPAIQYLRANRMRGELIRETELKLREVDFVLGANDLLLTNLTGHPSIVVSCSSEEIGDRTVPGVVKLTAAAYQEQTLLRAGQLLQAALPAKPDQPPLDEQLAELAKQQEEADSDAEQTKTNAEQTEPDAHTC